jgi:hypothetical protein
LPIQPRPLSRIQKRRDFPSYFTPARRRRRRRQNVGNTPNLPGIVRLIGSSLAVPFPSRSIHPFALHRRAEAPSVGRSAYGFLRHAYGLPTDYYGMPTDYYGMPTDFLRHAYGFHSKIFPHFVHYAFGLGHPSRQPRSSIPGLGHHSQAFLCPKPCLYILLPLFKVHVTFANPAGNCFNHAD